MGPIFFILLDLLKTGLYVSVIQGVKIIFQNALVLYV